MRLTLQTADNAAAFAEMAPAPLMDTLNNDDAIVIGAVGDDDTLSGMLIATMRIGAIKLNWLYVEPQHRGRGIAGELLRALLEAAESMGRIVQVTAAIPEQPQAAPVYRLLHGCGFELRRQASRSFSFTLGQLAEQPFFRGKQPSAGVLPLSGILDYTRAVFEKQLSKIDTPVPLETPINWEAYNAQCSVGYIVNNQLEGLFLVEEDGDGLYIAFVYARQNSRAAFPAMIRGAAALAAQLYPPETPVRASALEPLVEKLIHKLLPDSKQEAYLRAVYQCKQQGRE